MIALNKFLVESICLVLGLKWNLIRMTENRQENSKIENETNILTKYTTAASAHSQFLKVALILQWLFSAARNVTKVVFVYALQISRAKD